MIQIILGIGWIASIVSTALITKNVINNKPKVHFSINEKTANGLLEKMDPIIRSMVKKNVC